MSPKSYLGPLQLVLKEQNLIAFIINQGWLLIRRKDYIDVFIQNQPYNSVQVLFHVETKVRHFTKYVFVKVCNYVSCIGFRGSLYVCGESPFTTKKGRMLPRKCTRFSHPNRVQVIPRVKSTMELWLPACV